VDHHVRRAGFGPDSARAIVAAATTHSAAISPLGHIPT
jgi:hypothetical protein